MRPSRIVCIALAVFAGLSFVTAAWDLATGGFHVALFGIRLSSWEVYKPLRNGIVAGALALAAHDLTAAPTSTSWAWLARYAGAIVACVAIAFVVMSISWSADVAGGSDEYGYVSEAMLWASGRLVVPDRLAALSPTLGPSV